jgi:peptidoglycan/xylan/chitin deacetylase (PgdA/CDA1 family)
MAIRYGTTKGAREILFTFDDGPNPKTTPKLLDALAAHDIKAMFFVLGERIATTEGRSIMERAHREGHHIGNHTYSHQNLKTLSEQEIRDELNKTQDIIGACAHECKFFRPPYGATNVTVNKILQEEGYMTILWTVDTEDWKRKTDAAWVDYAMDQIKSREDSNVLMHDIHPSTVNNVEDFIKRINRMAKVEFVQYA